MILKVFFTYFARKYESLLIRWYPSVIINANLLDFFFLR